jgi:hypothetical protein
MPQTMPGLCRRGQYVEISTHGRFTPKPEGQHEYAKCQLTDMDRLCRGQVRHWKTDMPVDTIACDGRRSRRSRCNARRPATHGHDARLARVRQPAVLKRFVNNLEAGVGPIRLAGVAFVDTARGVSACVLFDREVTQV